MSFRARLALVAAAAVALAVVLASVTTYVVVRDQLRGTVDDALQERADEISPRPIEAVFGGHGPSLGGAGGYPQLVREDGAAFRPRGRRNRSRSTTTSARWRGVIARAS